jgi:hypothetical protein
MMREIMDAARFATLAEAYGGAIDQWPAAERAAARSYLEANDAARLLAEATRIDALLDAYLAPAPGAALIGRIIADAPSPWLWTRAKLWWSGLGLTGAALAGALVGAAATAAVPPPQNHALAIADEAVAATFAATDTASEWSKPL